jgi:hypothetical protein
MKVWLLVTSDENKATILEESQNVTFLNRMEIYSTVDMKKELGLL